MQPYGQPLATGTVLENRYRIITLLGEGGMSRVYLADAIRLGTRVAVKENLQTDPHSRAQFEREAQILARLSHPNLPRVTDHFTDAATGRQYLVMDYIEGEDLEQMIARVGRLPEATALAWVQQILYALEYLHSQTPPVVHRDIKPANIKITPQGKAVLVDFGIAKTHDPARGTLTGARAVTPGYAPPEQYGLRTDQRSDIYALGATLYTMLTGRIPPEAPLRASGDVLIPPRQLVPALSPQTEGAILRAVELQPTLRWQTAREFRTALTPRPVAAPPTSTSTAQARTIPVAHTTPARRTMTWVLIGLSILGTMAFIGLIALLMLFVMPAPKPILISTRIILSETPTRGLIVAGSPIPTAVSPPFTPSASATWTPVLTLPTLTATPLSLKGQIAFLSNRASNEPAKCSNLYQNIYVMNADGTNVRRLTNTQMGDDGPVWSPDGRLIAFTSNRDGNSEIYVMNADGTNQRNLTNTNRSVESDPSWSPDGRLIAFLSTREGDRGREIYVMRADGTEQHRLTSGATAYWGLKWSPDGRSIAFVSYRDENYSGNTQIYVINADGTNWRNLTRYPAENGMPAWSPDGRFIAFVSNRDGNNEIYVMNADGTNPRRLANTPSSETFPTWSPDGRLIAFSSDRDGNPEIYVMNADGTNPRNLTRHPACDSAPTWAP